MFLSYSCSHSHVPHWLKQSSYLNILPRYQCSAVTNVVGLFSNPSLAHCIVVGDLSIPKMQCAEQQLWTCFGLPCEQVRRLWILWSVVSFIILTRLPMSLQRTIFLQSRVLIILQITNVFKTSLLDLWSLQGRKTISKNIYLFYYRWMFVIKLNCYQY